MSLAMHDGRVYCEAHKQPTSTEASWLAASVEVLRTRRCPLETDPNTTEQTSVYRYFDEYDLPLYVGVTKRGTLRQGEHTGKEWWGFVNRQTVEHFPSRLAALTREAELIRAEHPAFNRALNEGSDAHRANYLRFRKLADRADVLTLARDLNRKLPLHLMTDWVDDLGVRRGIYLSRLEHVRLSSQMQFEHRDRPLNAGNGPQLGGLYKVGARGPLVEVGAAFRKTYEGPIPTQLVVKFVVYPRREGKVDVICKSIHAATRGVEQ